MSAIDQAVASDTKLSSSGHHGKVKLKKNGQSASKTIGSKCSSQQPMTDSDYSDESFGDENVEQHTGPKVMQFTFTPEKIMMQMNKQLLKRLRAYWESKEEERGGEGLSILEFTELIMSSIHTDNDDEKYELIHGCYKLFQQVDINGDGDMQWGEFLQYIVDAVSGSAIQAGEGREPVRDQLIQLRAQAFKKFDRATKPLDKTKHKNELEQAINCQTSKVILTFERFGKELKFYDHKMGLERKVEIPFQKQAFISHVTYDAEHMIYGCTCTDGNMYFYKAGRLQVEYYKTIKAPCIQARIWYMAKQKFWLTAGGDRKVRHWSIEKQGKMLQALHIEHDDEVTDCVEILNPMCIATCSLDQTIILYDVEHNEALTRINDYHEKGIRMLCYQKENGGNLISIGNETFANVWAPESLVSDMHNGRLSGHKKAIVDGKFLNNAPHFITIDITNLIMFWDIKTKQCVQQIASKFKSEVNGIVVVKNNIFWIYGERFFQYDTSMFEMHEKIDNEDSFDTEKYPVCAQLNEYLFQEIVVMKQEVRMYDMITGKLMSIYNNVFKEEYPTCEITNFKIDKRHRCAYVSNNKGRIYVINCQNGVILKNVTQFQEDQENIKAKNQELNDDGKLSDIGSSNYASDKEELNMYEDVQPRKKGKKNGPENASVEDAGCGVSKLDDPQINDMILIWETPDKFNSSSVMTKDDMEDPKDLIMMICSTQKEFFVYDEAEPTESRLLRRVSGAHTEEITLLAFDFHLSLIATGYLNGDIALFDFEMSRLEGILIGHDNGDDTTNKDITAIEFVSPYPLLISASMDNTVCIWGVRPIPNKLQNVCLKQFVNVSWNYKTMAKCPVSRMKVWVQEKSKGIRRYRSLKGEELLAAPTYRIFEHNWVFGNKSVDEIWDEEIAPTRLSIQGQATEDEKFQAALKSKLYQEILEDGKSKLFLTQGDRDEEYNDTLDELKDRIYLFLGDEQGFLKIWNLTEIIKATGVQPCKSMPGSSSHAFNPYRTEKVDLTETAKTMRTTYPGQKMPAPVDPAMTGVLIRQAKAHMEVISSLEKIDLPDFKGLITCGKDNKVRNWNLDLDLLGNINQNTDIDDPKWKFPSKQHEVEQMAEIEKIEDLIDQMQDGKNRMGLQFERRKLVVDGSGSKVQVDEKIKTRANWFAIQQEQEKQEEEMLEVQEKLKRDMAFDQARSNLIINKIERTIAEQEIKMHQLQMNFPNKLEDGMCRDLQTQLNGRQVALTDGLREELAEHEANKLKIKAKASNLVKVKRKTTVLNLGKHASIQQKESSRHLSILNSPSKVSMSNEESSTALSPMKKESTYNTRKSVLGSVMSVQKEDTQAGKSRQGGSKDRRVMMEMEKMEKMANLEARKQYRVPTPKQRTVTLSQMVKNSKFHVSPNQIFEGSKNDRQNILALQNIPKLRNICNTLTVKDPAIKISTSPSQYMQQKSVTVKSKQRYQVRMKERKHSEAPPRPDEKSRNMRGLTFKARPMSIADSEIQKINDFDGALLIKNNSQDSFDTHDGSRKTSLPQIKSGTISASTKSKYHKLPASMFHKQQFPISKTQIGNTPPSPQQYATSAQDRVYTAAASIDNILKQDQSRIISIEEEGRYPPFKKDKSNIIQSDPKRRFQFDDMKLPSFSQAGSNIPKIISRNPLNSYNTASQASHEAAIDYVLEKERRKRRAFHRNSNKDHSTVSPMNAPSTRHQTELHEMSNILQSQSNIFKDHERTPMILHQNQLSIQNDSILNPRPSHPQARQYSNMIARSQDRISSMLTKQKSGSISPRDLVRSQQFQLIKEKYTGTTPFLAQEKQKYKMNKDRLEQQRDAMAKMRKNYRAAKGQIQ